MRDPRKRILALVPLLLSWGLVGISANSSEAKPRSKGAAQKNHSVKKQKNVKSNQVSNAGRRGAERTRATTSERDNAIRLALKSRSEASPLRVAAKVDKKPSRVARTPRATTRVDNTRTSSPQIQAPAEESAVREALARRREWAEPRQGLLLPAQVKDPPATTSAAKTVGARSDRTPLMDDPGQAPVLLARTSPEAESAANEDLVREALSRRGTPYVWGGSSRGGFDCSGFICYIFAKQRGVKLPHSASAQARLGASVGKDELQPGDVVFFTTYRPGISHVGMFVGEGKFVHAANRRRGCRIDAMSSSYYSKRFICARRYSKAPLKISPEELKPYLENSSELPTGP